MMKISEVLIYEKDLNDFRSRMGMVSVNCAYDDVCAIAGNADAIFAERNRLAQEASRLFQEIGKQVCLDYEAEWGSEESVKKITIDSELSAEAEQKFKLFLKFINEH
jgi:hypothetical protein